MSRDHGRSNVHGRLPCTASVDEFPSLVPGRVGYPARSRDERASATAKGAHLTTAVLSRASALQSLEEMADAASESLKPFLLLAKSAKGGAATPGA